jgi:hypothetical protein
LVDQVLETIAQTLGAPAEAPDGLLAATANRVTDFFAAVRRRQQRDA